MEYPSETVFRNIVTHGFYFYPAQKHYPFNPHLGVSCDKCGKKRLTHAIGWQTYDLCLQCAADVTRSMEIAQPTVRIRKLERGIHIWLHSVSFLLGHRFNKKTDSNYW